ncbi:hypothetical protein [Flavobacterium aciduliphilum]|uniref:Long-subunit fatty acid transport protein n=1 Tax=Flavobacterium aciduliphilum TaxID=1101402 RepID=A0A328YU64_9FLAO|nr:hypothetical protein [Flavobacterium aciduliphilum]RAR74097.1 hypothetical protein CLV55_10225 [Flavobacterium aciduliphilum]
MIKKLIFSITLLFSLASFSQQSTSSPYSFYGIGDVRYKGSVENRSIGGVGVVPDSIHVNILNPASYAGLKLINYTIGGSFTANKLHTDTQDEKAQRTTLDYLAVAIPFKKFGFGFGLLPYSSVGYYNSSSVVENNINATHYYTGNGGLNKVFFGLGYQITKHFRFGADVQYDFGKIDTKNVAVMYDANGVQIQYGSREVNSSVINGVNFNTGFSFDTKINQNVSLFSSITYAPEAKVNVANTRTLATVQVAGTAEAIVGDPIDVSVPSTKLRLPSKFTFGLGIGDPKKWFVGSEVILQQSSDFGNRYDDITNVSFENAKRFSFGGYYTPNYKSFTKYFHRVTYRGGFRYENTGLLINNQSINDSALTLGIGMPLRGTFSNINLGFELGSRGTKNNGLVKENYMNFSIGLSFNDRWFIRRKYD